jgi:RNA polymerase sigma-70 factor (ECF subfamily)
MPAANCSVSRLCGNHGMMGAMRQLSDRAIIERSVAAPSVFEQLFERHFAQVLRYLRRRVGDDLADDLAGEVFVQAFAARTRYEPRTDSALPWLLGIATNLVRMHWRAEERRLSALTRLAATPLPAAGLPEPNDARIAVALAALPHEQRDVLLLHCWADLTHDEIAHALGFAVGTSRSYLARARATLAGALTPELLGGTK